MSTANKSELFKRAHARAKFCMMNVKIKAKYTYREVFAQCLRDFWKGYNGEAKKIRDERNAKLTKLARSNKKVAQQLAA